MNPHTPLLTVDGLTVRFGGLVAVNDVSFTVSEGSVHGLIGPNGAGKTTAFNLISGLYTPNAGTITLADAALVGKPTWERARCGLARTFQNIRMFAEMTALENVMTGAHRRVPETLASSLLRLSSFRDAERSAVAQAQKLLAFVGLAEAAGRPAGALPYGDQRRLEIARALASQPKLLMLDEPAAGMNPSETARLVDLLVALKDTGLTLLIVEHDMHFIMRLCDRITVLNFGKKIADGTPSDIRSDPAVIEAYLGAKVARSLETAAAEGVTVHRADGTGGVSASALLEVRGLSLGYGRVEAVKGIDIDVAQGMVVCLIGTNGAGKTTTLRGLSGLLRPREGTIRFDGQAIGGRAAHAIARMGIVQVPEGRQVFADMTVDENLAMGAYMTADRAVVERRRDDVLVRFPRLRERLGQPAGLLSGGEQQMLAIGRALMADPKLLLLDEPSMGLAPLFVEEIFRIVETLKREGRTILLVEQNARAALDVSDHAYVIESGRIRLHGPARTVADDPQVAEAYLGGA